MSWNCSVCTFANDNPSGLVCVICGTPRNVSSGGGGSKRARVEGQSTTNRGSNAGPATSPASSAATSAGGYFLTRLPGEPPADHTTTLPELLRLNHLVSTVQFNFQYDLLWLMQQYPVAARTLPLMLVHGYSGDTETALKQESWHLPGPL